MAINLGDNIRISGPLPIDSRYFNNLAPYASTGETNLVILEAERYIGLTVNINGIEYWYKDGIGNGDLVEKKYDSEIPSGDFVTGATNIGYFSGKTGVQILPINNLDDNDYDGNYYSLYNYFYRGTDGNIHIGTPSDGILKRGYVKLAAPVKSWIWNEYTGGSNLLGWILIDGNIENQLGTFQNGVTYYDGIIKFPYTATTWNSGSLYNNGSNVSIDTVIGSLTTGSTLTIGARPFAEKSGAVLDFRTIISDTPDLITVCDDSTFIRLSGNTGNGLITASNGLTKTGTNVTLGGILTGTTIITDGRIASGRTGIEYAADYSTSFTNNSLVTKCYVDSISALGGERIFKTICQADHGFACGDVIGWSGGTYNLPIANGTYDGEVLGIVSKCFNVDCFELTQAGYVTGLTGLITNCTYFLSEATPGLLTPIEPSVQNYLSKSMLIATSVSSGWVLPYAGYIITSGITNGGALVKSVCVLSNTITTYTIKPNDFYIGARSLNIPNPNYQTIYLPEPAATCPGMVVVVTDYDGCAGCDAGGCLITISGAVVGHPTAIINSPFGSLSFINNGSGWNVIGFAPTPA